MGKLSTVQLKSSQYMNKISVWDETAARHILSRTLFGYTQNDLNFALSTTLDDFVDNYLLVDTPVPADPTDPIITSTPDSQVMQGPSVKNLQYWWFDLMRTQGISLREKMVLFWHNHFVSEVTKVKYPQLMYIQNKLFRQFAFGNFKELTKNITIDPAMLIYLDGVQNKKQSPNENYARELMELFTLGIGNYTEDDVQQAAKALTGWRLPGGFNGAPGITSTLNSQLFDNSTKTFLRQTGNFSYEDVINIIFTQPAVKTFLCRKLYAEFVYYEPNEEYVTQMGQIFFDNNFELKPVFSAILKSTFFHSSDIIGAKIKSPVEIVMAAINQFQITTPDNLYLSQQLNTMLQTVLNPPNVKGWLGQRAWIGTSIYAFRNSFTDSIINGKKSSGGNLSFKVDVITFTRSFSSSEDAPQFIEDISKYFFEFPLSQARIDFLLTTLLDGTTVSDYSTFYPESENRLIVFYKALMRLAEFQLT